MQFPFILLMFGHDLQIIFWQVIGLGEMQPSKEIV